MELSFNQVEGLFKEVQPFFLRAGISPHQCKLPTGDINIIPTQTYIDVFDWLSEILQSPEWEEVQRAWKLVPAKTWKEYETYEIKGLQEQKILNIALDKFRPLWRKDRPSAFFGKYYETEQDQYQEDSE